MKIIEVTGVSGVGKSYIINQMAKDENYVLDTTIEENELSDFKLFYLFFKTKNAFKMFFLINRVAVRLNISLFHKLNFIRNSIKKIGKNSYLLAKKSDKIALVDEGISQLFQNIITVKESDDENNLRLVKKIVLLSEFRNEILIIQSEDENIFERLSSRGHKRLKNENEMRGFIAKSRLNMEIMIKKFKEEKICMSYQKN